MTSDPLFRMTIADIFFIKGRGIVATGRIEGGTLKVGDAIQVARSGRAARAVTVTGIEKFHQIQTEARAGDDVGVVLRGVEKNDLQPGDVLLGS